MNAFKITNSNRDQIQNKYVDSMISHMDFMEIRQLLREMLHTEKDNYTNEELEDEIKSRDPAICIDVFGRAYYVKGGESHETC